MDFQLTHEQVLIQESMRKMVERDINPILKSQDPDKPLTREVTRQIIDICAPLGLKSVANSCASCVVSVSSPACAAAYARL